ncbi:MAG: hypothetical protein IKW89_06670 [Bacteroidales bacterium]|nr:hypothetical protein [Bacteroidales bacterium]
MSKTYHTRKSFEQRIRAIRQVREQLAEESSVTVLSSLNQFDSGLTKAKVDLSRHPSGKRASGLRRDLRGKLTVKDFRNRFGVAEERSSRLRRLRKAAKHSARNRLKKETVSLDQLYQDIFD